MKYHPKRFLRKKSNRSRLGFALVFGVAGSIIIGLSFAATPSSGFTNVTTNPIDPAYLTSVGFGQRSDWVQPWRAYMDTVPSTKLLNAVGVNFNVFGNETDPTARLLAANGFKLARIEIGWNNIDYNNPAQLDPTRAKVLQDYITTFKKYGIRPLILLNANHGGPGPALTQNFNITAPAKTGDTTVKLDSASVAQVSPNYTGINGLGPKTRGVQAAYRIMSVSNGIAQLSQPLDTDVAVGTYRGATQKFLPFYPPVQDNGQPSPQFQQTMNGWLQYTSAVTKAVKQYYGSDDFDVEIWNELSFGSGFLYPPAYYSPLPAGYSTDQSGQIRNNLLTQTIDYLRDPANGVPNVKIGNGFTSEAPWGDGNNSPVGLTAIDKHPYYGLVRRPSQGQAHPPIDATGHIDPTAVLGCWQTYDHTQPASYTDTNNNGKYDNKEPCTGYAATISLKEPNYNLFLPEGFLNGVTTETVIRDTAPFANNVGGFPAGCQHSVPLSFSDNCSNIHGRGTKPCPTCTPPELWITEINLGPTSGSVADPANPAYTSAPVMTPQEDRHIATKDYLRYLSAFVNKGFSVVDFYAAGKAGDLSLIEQPFFDQLAANKNNPAFYPGNNAGGQSVDAINNLVGIMKQGAAPLSQAKQLTLTKIADNHNNFQFPGDGTVQHPPLYDRDVLAVLPFQVNDNRFAIPAYVMTRNVARVYQPNAPNTTGQRFDLPPEAFQITLNGFDPSKTLSAYAVDPITNLSTPVSIVSQGGGTVVLQADLTDSPRVIVLDANGGGAPPPPPADTTPPDTSITASPSSSTTSTSASFSFTSSESSPTFECKLDSGTFVACTTPQSYAGLTVGSHTFSVRAKDTAGNQDASPATYIWTITTSSTPPPTNTPKSGDVTGPNGSPDGKIDIFDLSFIIRNYGTSNTTGDITGPSGNKDGKIDIFDLSFIIRNYGK